MHACITLTDRPQSRWPGRRLAFLVTGAWYDGGRAGWLSFAAAWEFKLACSCVSVRSTGRKVALVDAPDKGRVPH
jgi:hypothetical protein